MKIGATTFVFRYLLRDTKTAPPLVSVVGLASEAGLDRFQICENARPLDGTPEEWDAVLERAKALGLGIQMGCKILDAGVLERYLARASAIPSGTLRVVLEDESSVPTRDRVDCFLQSGARLAEKHGMRLAIENHFDIPVRELVRAVQPYPADLIGFCVDAANSLRRFETAEFVFECLGPRALCYHLKDYMVTGTDVGFTVGGAPLGKGALDLDHVLGRILSGTADPEVYLENWVPSTGDLARDVAADREWLLESIANLRLRLKARAAQSSAANA